MVPQSLPAELGHDFTGAPDLEVLSLDGLETLIVGLKSCSVGLSPLGPLNFRALSV